MKSIRDVDVASKRVLVRVDFDVPLENGVIVDDTRIRAALPTLQFLLERDAEKIILLTHLGRPGGTSVDSLSVVPVAARLGELLSQNLTSQKSLSAGQAGSGSPQTFVQQGFASYEVSDKIFILENLRFDSGEEANDPAFAKKLATLGDLYVNDAFADSHRAHASIVGIPTLLPHYAGLALEEEIKQLSQAFTPPANSLAIIAGAKSETKLPLIEKFSGLYKKVLVGGVLANEYTSSHSNVLLPVDGIPRLKGMFDIGKETQRGWSEEIKKSDFVLWNGTVGMYEKKEYSGGTEAVAQALVDSTCHAVLGGGDTLAATKKFTFDPKRIFVSTGGGAMLQFLADGTLPGIEVLKK